MKKLSGIFNLWVCFISFLDVLMAESDFASNQSSPRSRRFFLVSPPPHFPPPPASPYKAPFRPGIVIVVAILTTMFSAIFLILLYARYYKLGTGGDVNGSGNRDPAGHARKNSGVDRLVVESLPMFRFSSLGGQKEGLECAVCLNAFESNQVLRLLPKCRHAFHVECVDTWLDAHSTCPLCRHRVDPEDVLLIQKENESQEEEPGELTRRVSGRHSSAGENKSKFVVQILVERPSEDESTQWCRKSVDSALSSGVRNDGLLLTEREKQRRLEHRIVWEGGARRRWSDLRPSDMLNVESRMMGREKVRGGGLQQKSLSVNSTSVSEVTGLSRFANNGRGKEGPRCASSVE